MKAAVQIFKREDPTFESDDLDAEARWSYYVSSYIQLKSTEGVDLARVRYPFLHRSLPAEGTTSAREWTTIASSEDLVIRVSVDEYKLRYDAHPGSKEWFFHSDERRSGGGREGIERAEKVKEQRAGRFAEKMVMNNAWMKGLSKNDVDAKNEEFRKFVKGETAFAGESRHDQEMVDA